MRELVVACACDGRRAAARAAARRRRISRVRSSVVREMAPRRRRRGGAFVSQHTSGDEGRATVVVCVRALWWVRVRAFVLPLDLGGRAVVLARSCCFSTSAAVMLCACSWSCPIFVLVRLLAEVEALMDLTHPNIVQLHECVVVATARCSSAVAVAVVAVVVVSPAPAGPICDVIAARACWAAAGRPSKHSTARVPLLPGTTRTRRRSATAPAARRR